MTLPEMEHQDRIGKNPQTVFGGLDRRLGAGDGAIASMRNLTARYYPLLATRDRRARWGQTVEDPNGYFEWNGYTFIADGTRLLVNGTAMETLTLTDTLKTFVNMGDNVVIYPDKVMLLIEEDAIKTRALEAEASAENAVFQDGEIYGEAAEANCLELPDVGLYNLGFRPGDAVTISGCTVKVRNNLTAIIREMDGDKLYFYENTFELIQGEHDTSPVTEPGPVTVKRSAPNLDGIFESGNRLWGYKGDTIYASKLGDPTNWEVYDGLDSDSWTLATGGEDITGGISYLGYPTFFKQNLVIRIYGSAPRTYETAECGHLGVKAGSAQSLAIADEVLYYLSPKGFCAFRGSTPAVVDAALGTSRKVRAVSGSDGLRYFAATREMFPEQRDGKRVWREENNLLVYDTATGLWHKEDETQAVCFARTEGLGLVVQTPEGKLWRLDPDARENEASVSWNAEFADFVQNDPNKKGISKLQIRLELDELATCAVQIMYDSSGQWEQVADLTANVKRSYYLAVIPRRCDHYRLRLEGEGACRVYSLARETYSGSELKSTAGRQ